MRFLTCVFFAYFNHHGPLIHHLRKLNLPSSYSNLKWSAGVCSPVESDLAGVCSWGSNQNFQNLLTRSKFESKLPLCMVPGNLTPREKHTPGELITRSRIPGSMLLPVVRLSGSMLLRGVWLSVSMLHQGVDDWLWRLLPSLKGTIQQKK